MDGETHILQGNLGRDPEWRKLQSGDSICKLRLPVGIYKTENGERKKVGTNYYTITAFRDYADFLAEVLHKGSPVKIHGSNLSVRTYQNKEGETKTDLEIIVNNGDVTVVQYAPRKGKVEPKQETFEEVAQGGEEDADIPF